jgi:hypothetical protein
MQYSDKIDIKILMDRIRLCVDGAKAVNKRYSQWSEVEIIQWAFPLVTYCSELVAILDSDEVKELVQEYEHSDLGR